MTCRGLAWCTLAALAEAQRAIKRLKAKTERIAFAPIDQPPFLCDARPAMPQLRRPYLLAPAINHRSTTTQMSVPTIRYC
jgi:hypothetical protein